MNIYSNHANSKFITKDLKKEVLNELATFKKSSSDLNVQ